MSASRVESTRLGIVLDEHPRLEAEPGDLAEIAANLLGLRASAPTMSTPFSIISRVATEFIAPTPYTIALIRFIGLLPSRG